MNLRSLIRSLRTVIVLLCLGSSGTVFSQTIDGHRVVCLGASRTTLTCATAGGTWSSANPARATIDPTSGVVTGVSTGTTTISYELPSSSFITAVVTVNFQVMNPIGFSMGSASRCTGGATATCTVSPKFGNEWTSSDATIATINTGGLVTPSPTNAGTTTISYRHGTANCYVTREVTVNTTPTVTATTSMCNGTTQTVTATPGGGSWSSSNTSVGTVHSTTGVMSALAGGGTTIYNTATTGCVSSRYITVLALPGAITGTTTLCEGNTSTLASSTSGGTWSSSNTTVATIGTSGIVSALAAGTTTITYTVGSGCERTTVVTVNSGLPSNTGLLTVCTGQTTTLSNATGGGTWSSSTPSVATVVTGSGLVTGIAAGTANISYRVGAGCSSVSVVTVNATLAAIGGSSSVCVGASTTLTHAVGGGTWSASNANATIGSTSGVLTGVTAGAVVITYAISSGCYKTMSVIIKAVPSAIAGASTVCAGTSTTLSSATGGGTWSSSNTGVATVGSASGSVTGVSGGTATITYAVTSTGCFATREQTVNSAPSITGSSTVCIGTTSTLSSSTGGGTWTSSDTSVATIGSSSGIVTGVSSGTSAITYTVGGSCMGTMVVTISATPSAITGTLTICAGSSTTLSNSTGGGTWSSGNVSVATVNSSGLVSSVSVGTAVISYTVAAGCSTTAVVTVSSTGGSISGVTSLYLGSGTTLSSSVGGGTWSSSNTAVATIGSSSGVVSTSGLGTTTISYSTGSGCLSTVVLTVSAEPVDITGPSSVIVSGSIVLTASIPGGTWSSSNVTIATVDTGGTVTGLSSGTVTISYIVSTVAGPDTATVVLTITPGPGPGSTSCSSSWKYLPGNWALPAMGEHLSVAVDNCGTPYIAYADTFGNLIVQKYDGGQFLPVGSGGVVGAGGNPCIQIAHDNRVFVAYYATSDGLTVRQFDGTTWSVVGTPGFASVSEFTMALDTAGVPYVAFQDGANDYKSTVMRYNGSTWVTVGTAGFSSVRPFHLNLVISNGGVPYLSSTDDILYFGTPIHGTVHRFTGVAWEILGDTTFSFDNAYKTSVAVDASGTPYVTYISPTSTGPREDSIRFVRFNGTSWEMINSLGFELQFAADASLKIGSDDVPYLVYLTGSDTYTEGSPLLYEQNHYSALKYDGINWVSLGYAGGNPLVPSPVFGECSWALNDHGVPYVAYLEDHIYSQGPVLIYPEDNEWKRVQTGQTLSRTGARAPEIAFDGDGNLYTAYIGAEYNFRTVVRKYNGHSWDFIGGPAFYPGMAYEWWPAGGGSVKLALGSGNTPYVAALASGLTGVAVTRFDGNNWVDVGAGGLSGSFYISDLDFVVESGGSPVVVRTGSDFDSSYFELNRYDGSAWVYAGSAYGNYEYPSLAADGSGNVYLSAVDMDHGGRVSVYKYDGSSFVALGSLLFTADTCKYTRIAVTPGGTPYVVFADGAHGYKASVMKYNGSAWVYVGAPGFTSAAVQYTSITLDASGNPCIVFYDGAEGNMTTVMKYDGSTWNTIGAAGISPAAGSGPTDITIGAGGDVYISYSGLGLGTLGYPPTGAVVMKYGSDAEIRGAREVCQGSSFAMSVYGDGTWSSSDPSVASVNCVGVVTGVSAGTATIIFTFDTCITTAIVTVNPAPSAGTLSGPSSVIAASTITLSSTETGGVWSSSNSAIATVGSASGIVTGVAPGVVSITYTVTGDCGLAIATRTVNVTASKPGVSGGGDGAGDASFSAYPNPTSGSISIESGVGGKVAMYTIDGRELHRYDVTNRTTNIQLPAGLSAGVYMLRFKGDDGSVHTLRLVYEP